MSHPVEHDDDLYQHELDRLMSEGGPDPEVLQAHRRAVQTTVEGGDLSKDEKSC